MRILVDGWELLRLERRRGIGRFLEQLLPVLAQPDRVSISVLQPAREIGEVPLPTGTAAQPVTRLVPRTRSRAGVVEHVARLPLELSRTAHDVAWSPGTLPFVWTPGPWIQTLHDLAPVVLNLPGHRFERLHWRMLGSRVRSANRVVAVSRFAADEGIRVLGLDPSRIEVVPHGVGPGFGPDGHRSALGTRYVAAVVSDDPRKGIPELMTFAERLSTSAYTLCVAGTLGLESARALTSAGAVVLGHVPDMPAFLRGASVVVVTSRHEGFGLVPLEAMACGTPVVAFDAGAVGEVVGEAGHLVPEGNLGALVRATIDILQDDLAAADLSRAGLARSRQFRWEHAARDYLEVFEAVA